MYLTELPLIVLLTLSIRLNSHLTTPGKLYPLIVTLILGIIFIFVYLFRLVRISYEEVRSIGRFSSRDSAILNEGKTLILTVMPRHRLHIAVFGNDGTPPSLDWAMNEEYDIPDIYLYRQRAVGNARTAEKILKFFSVPSSDARDALKCDAFSKEYDAVSLSAERRNEITEIKIKFKKTL